MAPPPVACGGYRLGRAAVATQVGLWTSENSTDMALTALDALEQSLLSFFPRLKCFAFHKLRSWVTEIGHS